LAFLSPFLLPFLSSSLPVPLQVGEFLFLSPDFLLLSPEFRERTGVVMRVGVLRTCRGSSLRRFDRGGLLG
jgi:hypothetical protein